MQCPDEHTASERENITEKRQSISVSLKWYDALRQKPQELLV